MKTAIGLLTLILLLAGCAQQPSEDPQILRVGVLAALSGPAAVHGESFMRGVTTAVEEINADGTRIELVVQDNKNDPKEGITAYQELRLKEPDVIISSMSGASRAIAPLVKDDGTPMLMSLVVTPVNAEYGNSFRYFYTGNDYADAIVPFLESRGVKTVGIYHISSEAGVNGADPVEARLKAEGFEVVIKEAFDPTTTEHRTAALKIAAKDPDALYVWALRPDQVVADLKTQYNGVIIFNEIPASLGMYLMTDAFNGTYTCALPPTLEGTPQNDAFKERFGDLKNTNAALGYDLVNLMWNAFERGATPETLIPTIVAEPSYSGMMGDISIHGETRETNMPMRIALIQDRTLVPVE